MSRWSALLLLYTAATLAADGVSVETTRHGTAVEVRARALVNAAHATVWATVTDYEHLATFVPGMRSSRILGRRDGALIVEQRGETRFLVFTYPVDVQLLVTARPPDLVEVHLLSGTLKRLDGTYRLQPGGRGRVALLWTGLIEPGSLPPLLGELMMRETIRAQFDGMVLEIERRAALGTNTR